MCSATPVAYINPSVSAIHPVTCQLFQFALFPLMSSEISMLPASNPPLEIHPGTLDNETVPVATDASTRKRLPNTMVPLTGRRIDGTINSTRLTVTPLVWLTCPSNSSIAGAPIGLCAHPGRLIFDSSNTIAPRTCGDAVEPESETALLRIPSNASGETPLPRASFAICAASPRA